MYWIVKVKVAFHVWLSEVEGIDHDNLVTGVVRGGTHLIMSVLDRCVVALNPAVRHPRAPPPRHTNTEMCITINY